MKIAIGHIGEGELEFHGKFCSKVKSETWNTYTFIEQ